MTSRSVVVQYDPARHLRRRIGVACLCAGLFIAGLWVGGAASVEKFLDASAQNLELRARLAQLTDEVDRLRQWQEDNRTRAEVDAAALELVREELAAQQEMIAELERGIRFYRSLMAPGELAEGLNIRSIELIPEGAPNHYLFRVLVQQSARKHELMTGSLSVHLLGEAGGRDVEYNLAQLSEDVPDTDIRLRFKYFQAIDGELALPEGFTPRSVRVVASSSKPHRSEVSEEFPWSVQERVGHVGQ